MPLSSAKPSGPFGVLVVEDSADDEAMTLRGLRQCGLPLRVTVARDGAEAVEMLTRKLDDLEMEQAPRLVLLDLKLPKIGGIEVLQAVRDSDRAGTVPVVVPAVLVNRRRIETLVQQSRDDVVGE